MMLKRLHNWILSKAIIYAFDALDARHVGYKLNLNMNQRFGKAHSDEVQKRLALWLRQVAKELEG